MYLCIVYIALKSQERQKDIPNEKCTFSSSNVPLSHCRRYHLFQCLHFLKILMLPSTRLTIGQRKRFLLHQASYHSRSSIQDRVNQMNGRCMLQIIGKQKKISIQKKEDSSFVRKIVFLYCNKFKIYVYKV